MNILLAGDEPRVARFTQTWPLEEGPVVDVATDGVEALSLAPRSPGGRSLLHL